MSLYTEWVLFVCDHKLVAATKYVFQYGFQQFSWPRIQDHADLADTATCSSLFFFFSSLGDLTIKTTYAQAGYNTHSTKAYVTFFVNKTVFVIMNKSRLKATCSLLLYRLILIKTRVQLELFNWHKSVQKTVFGARLAQITTLRPLAEVRKVNFVDHIIHTVCCI